MTTIIDAFAKLRLLEACQALLSPQNDEPQPQYVAARKRHKSGRRGRISVYRVVDDHCDDRGRRVRKYANVEGDDIDDDERKSFVGTEKKNSIKRGQSVRQKKKDRTLQSAQTPKMDKPQAKIDISQEDKPRAKRPLIESIRETEVSRGRRLKRGNTRQAAAKACAQAKARRSRPEENYGASPPDNRRERQKASDSGISSNAGVTYNRADRATQTLHESDFMCSGALPVSSRPTRPQKAAADHNAIKAMEGAGAIHKDYDASDPSEVLSSSFRQPLLSPQESKRLVFGVRSTQASRSRLRLDQDIRFNKRTIGQQLAEEQQSDSPLRSTIEEPEAPRPLLFQSSVKPDIQRDEDEFDNPFVNPMSTPSHPPTSTLRCNYAVDASTSHHGFKIRQPTSNYSHNTGAPVGQDMTGEDLPGTGSPRGVPGFPIVHGGFLDRLQGMNPPGTPPYTPAGANPFQLHKTLKPELEEA